MTAFFDTRADGYDAHMRRSVESFSDFYGAVAAQLGSSEGPVAVLDIGCGTGLELDGIFETVPNARVTCIDLSANMLSELVRKHSDQREQLNVVQGSYLTLPLGESCFDAAVSVMTVHHLLPDGKQHLYEKIRRALKPGGLYVEGDYVVSHDEELRLLREYARQAGLVGGPPDGTHHIDIPFSIETQKVLLVAAGFSQVEVAWRQGAAAVLVARS
jgi:tRNA (cmo5U34)-methyltransferase